MRALFLALVFALASQIAHASTASVFTVRPDDPAAVTLSAPDFQIRGDGVADDSAAIQAAVDKAASTPSGGLLFVPPGRYRLTRTILVWRGVRLVGVGATRPVFVLADNTPGYQKGIGLMVMFTHASPSGPRPPASYTVPFPPPGMVPPRDDIPDAGPSTFYPGMSNIDFEIGDGNPAAIAIRFHVAQHGVLSHMDFHIGSGLAGLTQIGNEAEDLHFHGGRYGILTDNTSPFWQFTLIDSTFDGQREAAIREHMAQLTLIRDTFRNVPVAVDIDPHYSDQLYVKDGRFEHVSKAALVISNERNATTEVGVDNAICAGVATFARFRESGKTLSGVGPIYRVKDFNYGLFVPALGTMGHLDTTYRVKPLAALPDPMPPAIRPLPPMDQWVNVRTLGVKGDGETDDTAALQAAVDAHPVLYLPSGYYIVRDTILLKPDTVLIALHPATTTLDLPDSTPAFQGVGTPMPLVQAPQGGSNIVSGLGFFAGGINPRALSLLWMAGDTSLMNDVQIFGGGGSYLPANLRAALFPSSRGGAVYGPDRWGAQYPSIWVTRGGGGTFTNIWSPDTYAQGGFYVSDTTTPGHVYELSNEHHLFNEITLDRVENWEFLAPQTEEEAPTSPEAVSFEIAWSKHITIANYHGYRVTRSHAPFPAAVRIYNSSDLRFRNVHVNAESGYGVCDANGCGTFLRASKFPYENAIQDVTHHLEVREHEFAVLDVPGGAGLEVRTDAGPKPRRHEMIAPGARLRPLESGFYSISGATVDSNGVLYFVDRHQHRIFSWSASHGLNVVRHDALDPVNLAVDRSGHLLVASSAGPEGTVYSFAPGSPADEITVLTPQASASRPGAAYVHPANVWDNGEFANQLDLDTYEYKTLARMFAEDVGTPKAKEYVSPDGSLVLPAVRVFQQGPDDSYAGMDVTGWRWSNTLNAYGLVSAKPGEKIYVASSEENRTYRATVKPDGTLGDLTPFAERGGESVAWDVSGNVYVANGQVFVYDGSGRSIGRIDVPQRPIQILFGGAGHRTLFVLTHHTLYAVKTR